MQSDGYKVMLTTKFESINFKIIFFFLCSKQKITCSNITMEFVERDVYGASLITPSFTTQFILRNIIVAVFRF